MIGDRIIRLTKDTLIYGFGSALTSVMGIVLVPILTRILTPGEYGVMDLLVTVVFLASVILSFGLDSALGVLFYREDTEDYRQRLLSTVTLFVVLLAVVATILAAALSPWYVSWLLPPDASRLPIWLMFGIIPFSMLQSFVLIGLRFRFRRYAYLSVIGVNVTLTIALSILFTVVLDWGVSGYFLAWLLTVFVSSLVGLGILGRGALRSWDPVLLRRLLRIGLPLIPAGLAGWSLALIDRFFVKDVSLVQLGYYALSVKVSSILGLVVAALQLAWGPFALSIAKEPEAKQTYSRVLTLYLAIGGWVAVLLTALAPLIVKIFSGSAYESATAAVGPLLFGTLAYGAYSIVAIGVNIVERTAIISWTTALAATANIILNFLLIPRYGFVGAAYATALSYIISVLVLMLVSHRLYPIPYRRIQIITLAAWIILAMAGVRFITSLNLIGLSLALGGVLVYGLGLFAGRVLDWQMFQAGWRWIKATR